jgi:hypothetical protein
MEKQVEKQTEKKFLTSLEVLNMVSPDSQTISYKGNDVNIRLVEVTPELAKEFLKHTKINRPLSVSNVNFLTREILKNSWMLTGESIKFDSDGYLIDGQHRLNAIIKSGKKVLLMIMYGVDSNVFSVLDTGRKRTGSDVLAINGLENYTLAASTIRLINQFEKNSYGEGGAVGRTMSNQDVLKFYKNNLDISKSVSEGSKLYKKCAQLISPSIICALYYLFSKKSKEQADDFMNKLCAGVNLETNSPITSLRNKLIASKNDKSHRMIQSDVVKNIILAWNKYRKGVTSKKLKLSSQIDVITIE